MLNHLFIGQYPSREPLHPAGYGATVFASLQVPNYHQVLLISGKIPNPRIALPAGSSNRNHICHPSPISEFRRSNGSPATKTPATLVTGVRPITC